MVTAADGMAGVGTAVSIQPDLIIMDIAMPGTDVITAARLARLEPAIGGVPLVAVSASSTTNLGRARVAGFDDFYPIPIDPREFVARLEPHLPTARARRSAQEPP